MPHRMTTVVGRFMAGLALYGGLAAAQEPLPIDPRIQSTKLSNGLTCLFQKHANPPGRLALMLRVDSGSLNETEAQRGLAHFLEHMVFNGSEHYPPGTLIPYFESIGMQFGAHVNAFTDLTQTAYMLFLPDTKPDEIEKALIVMSDFAFRATLTGAEIDKERGVILSELRTGLSAEQRIMDKLWPELFNGSRLAQRLPIGSAEVIEKAPPPQFEDYYRAWYRPEHMTLMLVGDLDPAPLAPLIEKHFGGYRAASPARKPENAGLRPFSERRALVVTDPELTAATIELHNVRLGGVPTTTVETFRDSLVEQIASWIVDRRLEKLRQGGTATFQRAGTSISRAFDDAMLATAEAEGRPEDWEAMLDQLVAEVSRAREHGFTARELDLAKAETLSSIERAMKTDDTRNAQGVLFSWVSAIDDQDTITSAAFDNELAQRVVPTITLEEVTTAFRTHFGADTFAFVLQLPEKGDATPPTRDALLAAANAALALRTTPPADDAGATPLLAAAPTPGKVVESELDQDLGVTSAWLENGIRVRHRFMDYKKDTVYVSISLAGGRIEETPATAGLTEAATLAFQQAATKRLKSDAITDLLTGKNIGVSANVDYDSIEITVGGSPTDLETGLQLVHALLTEGVIEASAFETWSTAVRRQLQQLETAPEFVASRAVLNAVGGGDVRYIPMHAAWIDALKLDAAQAWLEQLSARSPIEVAIVGEVPLETAMPLIERYLGSLPKRERGAARLAALRKLTRAPGPWSPQVKFESVTPRAMVIVGFVVDTPGHVTDERALNLAGRVLSSRLIERVREELALVYSIDANNQPVRAFPDAGLFLTGAPCDPAKTEQVLAELDRIFASFAESGPTADELANAKKQILNELETQEKEPQYWWAVLRHIDLHNWSLTELKNKAAAYDAFTADQVRDSFRRYAVPERTFRAVATPVPKAAATETAPTP